MDLKQQQQEIVSNALPTKRYLIDHTNPDRNQNKDSREHPKGKPRKRSQKESEPKTAHKHAYSASCATTTLKLGERASQGWLEKGS